MITDSNLIINENSPLLFKEGPGVVQSFFTNENNVYLVNGLVEPPLNPLLKKEGTFYRKLYSSRTKSILTKVFTIIFILFFPLLLSAQTSQFFVQQGLLHYELKEYDEAIRNFETALQYPNPGRDLYMYLASSQLLNQNMDGAIKTAREGLDEYPDFLRLRVMKGEALIQTDLKQAIPLFEDIWANMGQNGLTEQDGIHKEDVGRYISRLYQQVAAEAFEANHFRIAANSY